MEQTLRKTDDQVSSDSTEPSLSGNHDNQGSTDDIPNFRNTVDSMQEHNKSTSHGGSTTGTPANMRSLFEGGQERTLSFSVGRPAQSPFSSSFGSFECNVNDNLSGDDGPADNGPIVTKIIEDNDNGNNDNVDYNDVDGYYNVKKVDPVIEPSPKSDERNIIDKEIYDSGITESKEKKRTNDFGKETMTMGNALNGSKIIDTLVYQDNVYDTDITGQRKKFDDNSFRKQNKTISCSSASRERKKFASKTFDNTPLLFEDILNNKDEFDESDKKITENPLHLLPRDIDDRENRHSIDQLTKPDKHYTHEFETTKSVEGSDCSTVKEITQVAHGIPKDQPISKSSSKASCDANDKTLSNYTERAAVDIDIRNESDSKSIQHTNINTGSINDISAQFTELDYKNRIHGGKPCDNVHGPENDVSPELTTKCEIYARLEGLVAHSDEDLHIDDLDGNDNNDSVMSIQQNFEEWNDSYFDLLQFKSEETVNSFTVKQNGDMCKDENMVMECLYPSCQADNYEEACDKNHTIEPLSSSSLQQNPQYQNKIIEVHNEAHGNKNPYFHQVPLQQQQQEDHHVHSNKNGSQKRGLPDHVRMFPAENDTTHFQCMHCGQYMCDENVFLQSHSHDNHTHTKSGVRSDKAKRNKNASVKGNKTASNFNDCHPDSNAEYTDTTVKCTEYTTCASYNDIHNKNNDQSYVGLAGLVESVGLTVKDVTADGNCLFASITDQLRIYGDFSFTPKTLRAAAVNFLKNNPFQSDGTPLCEFLDESEGNWDQYLNRMACNGHWGDHIVICALSQVLNRRIIIYGGYKELNKTVVEPHGTLTDVETESSSGEDVGTNEVEHVKEMYIGHMSLSHYVSLRPIDWKNKLLQELKNKLTSCLIGINPQSLDEGGDETEVDFPHEHVTFAVMYMHMSDVLKYITSNQPSSHEYHNQYSTSVLYHPMSDRMNVHTIAQNHTVDANGKITSQLIALVTPLDSLVLHSTVNAGVKDLMTDCSDCMPGYTRLLPVEPARWFKALDKNNHLKQLQMSKHMEDQQERSMFLSFKCEWPLDAAEWINRPRKSNWPPQHVIDDIIRSCGRIIPQSHPFSNNSDIEWKYCFLEAERILADSLTEPQLECFHTIKLVLDFILMETNIDIIILKQPFFYLCEEVNMRLWSSNTLECMHMYLNKLLKSLRLRYVQGYFLAKENFLLDDLTDEMITTCIERIEVLKLHTFPLLYFAFGACTSMNVTRNILFDGLIENIQDDIEGHDYNFTIHNCFLPLMANSISAVWKCKKYEEAFKQCEKAVSMINCIGQTKHPLSLHDLIICITNAQNSFLDRWLFAFYVDLKLQSKYVDNACDPSSTTSLRYFFGDSLVDYIHEKDGSETIPTSLIQTSELGQTCYALLEVLTQLQIPSNVYSSVIVRCLNHVDLILKSTEQPNISKQDIEWIIHDVKRLITKIGFFKMEEECKKNKKKIAANLFTIANIYSAMGKSEQCEKAENEAEDILKEMDGGDTKMVKSTQV